MKQINPTQKLVLVTRADLPSTGAILAQTVHATVEFSIQHRDLITNWHDISNYVACLEIKNEEELLKLAEKLESKNVKFSLFREPDYNNEATSMCIEACDESKRYTSHLSLALKNIIRPTSSTVRTSDSKSENVGSNPTWATNINQ